MQTDPIGYADGLNWYAYVGNDPVNKVDPLGLCGGTNSDANVIVVCADRPDLDNDDLRREQRNEGLLYGADPKSGETIVYKLFDHYKNGTYIPK